MHGAVTVGPTAITTFGGLSGLEAITLLWVPLPEHSVVIEGRKVVVANELPVLVYKATGGVLDRSDPVCDVVRARILSALECIDAPIDPGIKLRQVACLVSISEEDVADSLGRNET